jgi:hypothetical protein
MPLRQICRLIPFRKSGEKKQRQLSNGGMSRQKDKITAEGQREKQGEVSQLVEISPRFENVPRLLPKKNVDSKKTQNDKSYTREFLHVLVWKESHRMGQTTRGPSIVNDGLPSSAHIWTPRLLQAKFSIF